eukprot:9764264-Ditylum_brightwellii.AAC.2
MVHLWRDLIPDHNNEKKDGQRLKIISVETTKAKRKMKKRQKPAERRGKATKWMKTTWRKKPKQKGDWKK